ncbi:hypothetical protein E4U25_002634 [Claviceps purpurea]|nr:hypothetical protein E4U25_002634 [Claviceps purpurea]KAG6302227.1 hypothetical protein E4U45_002873 [Claviceps purpurea]
MSCGSSVLPLIVPAVPGDEIVQGTRKLREDLFLHLEAPIEVIEMFAQERLGCRVFSSYVEPNLTRAKAKAAIRTSVAVQDAAQER